MEPGKSSPAATPPCELCRNNSEQITPRMCANPEPMLQRHTTKPQTLRFSSHTSLFWTLPEQLSHITPRMCANPYWTNVPKHTTNFRSELFHLTHPLFELCRNNSEQITPRMCANPEPMFQRHTTKPQTLRFSSHTSLFWTLPEQLSMLHHACVSTHPEDTPQNLRPQDSHLTHPFFELCRSSSPCYTTHVSQPILNQRPKTHYKLQSENFHLTHPWFELCLNNSEQMTPRMCANPSWTNVPKTHHKTSDPKIFISHIPLLNFAGAALHITPRMCANPSWTNVPKHTTNFRSELFHLTHPCFELCRNSLPCYTTHVSQPILYQRPLIQHKRLVTQFCKPILIQPPKIHLSEFQCSPYRRQKCRALQEDTVEWKPVCNLHAKKGSQ